MTPKDPDPQTGPLFKGLDHSSKAALMGGAPLATVVVWVIENFFLPPNVTLNATAAAGLGIVGATVFGELWVVFKRLLDRIGGPT